MGGEFDRGTGDHRREELSSSLRIPWEIDPQASKSVMIASGDVMIDTVDWRRVFAVGKIQYYFQV